MRNASLKLSENAKSIARSMYDLTLEGFSIPQEWLDDRIFADTIPSEVKWPSCVVTEIGGYEDKITACFQLRQYVRLAVSGTRSVERTLVNFLSTFPMFVPSLDSDQMQRNMDNNFRLRLDTELEYQFLVRAGFLSVLESNVLRGPKQTTYRLSPMVTHWLRMSDTNDQLVYLCRDWFYTEALKHVKVRDMSIIGVVH